MAAEIMYSRLGEIAAATEATKGTKVVNANLVDGTKSKFIVYDIKWVPDISKHAAQPVSRYLSRVAHTPGTTFGRISFKMDLRKTAVTATEDAWGIFMSSCGLKFNSGTGAYAPTTDQSAHTTLTMYAFLGTTGEASTNTIRVGIRGAMGTAKLMGKIGERAQWEFEFFGIHETGDADGTPANTFALKPTADALNAVTHETGVASSFQGIALTYDSVSVVAPDFEWDTGNVLAMRESISSSGGGLHVAIMNREPRLRFAPDACLISIKDYLGQHNLGTSVAVAFSYVQPATSSPSIALRTFAFSAPACQQADFSIGDREGRQTWDLVLAPNISSGDDETTLTITGV